MLPTTPLATGLSSLSAGWTRVNALLERTVSSRLFEIGNTSSGHGETTMSIEFDQISRRVRVAAFNTRRVPAHSLARRYESEVIGAPLARDRFKELALCRAERVGLMSYFSNWGRRHACTVAIAGQSLWT